MRSDDDSDGKTFAQILSFQKITKYALFYSSVIVLKISRECFLFVLYFLLLRQSEIRLCWIYTGL